MVCFFSTMSWLALGPTKPPIQWVPGVEQLECKKLTTHLCLVPRSRMHGVISPLLNGYIFIAWYLVKHKENFTLHLYPDF